MHLATRSSVVVTTRPLQRGSCLRNRRCLSLGTCQWRGRNRLARRQLMRSFSGKPENAKKFMSWRLVALSSVGVATAAVLYQQFVHRRGTEQTHATSESPQIGGGNWQMLNHFGDVVTHETYVGKYQVVYFGFTFCPDVCPRELTKMARAMTLLEERGYATSVVPLFVSVDPKRDSPALVSKYIRQFHPQIVGLTGSPQQVAHFAKAYKAYYSTPPPAEEQSDDYIIDHVTMMYLMGRNGEYLGHVSTLENADEMAEKMIGLMKDVKPSSGFLSKFYSSPKTPIHDSKKT